MGRFVLTRLWQSALTLVLASIVIFLGIRALPGDPATAMAGEQASSDQIATIRAQLGLDEPIVVQYLQYMGRVVTGDFGRSAVTGAPISEMFAAALPVTIMLSGYAMLVAIVIGLALGVLAERRRGKWQEWVANSVALVTLSVPNFWLAIMAILGLAVALQLFPASGFVPFSVDPIAAIYHLTLPALILSTSVMAVIMRQTRASMLETMQADFVRTARAKGLSRSRVMMRYGLRNSLIVVVTIVGLQLGMLISGTVVTEQIFALPGIGRLTLNAVFARDYPVIQGAVLVITAGCVIVNFVVDALYSVINPRIRIGGLAS